MEIKHDHIRLTSGEIAVLWGSYINESLGVCTISYFLKNVDDPDVRTILEYALGLSKDHLENIRKIMTEENFPIPTGFTEQDVNVNAAKLFSDPFMLYYIQNIGALGINTYSIAILNSARKDIRTFYTNCIQSSTELYNRASDIMLEKGIFIRSPYIPYPKKVDFVEKQHFLGGWFEGQRPLTSNEISFLSLNLYRNTLGAALMTGFSQAAESKEVRQFMVRGAEIAKHHCNVFSKLLSDSDLVTPMSWDNMPFDSTEAPFSDKLMMYHTAALNRAGMGFYGASMGGTTRKDVAMAYGRLILEVGEFSKDGANIMIDKGWLEKPPSAADRKRLSKER